MSTLKNHLNFCRFVRVKLIAVKPTNQNGKESFLAATMFYFERLKRLHFCTLLVKEWILNAYILYMTINLELWHLEKSRVMFSKVKFNLSQPWFIWKFNHLELDFQPQILVPLIIWRKISLTFRCHTLQHRPPAIVTSERSSLLWSL